MRFKNIKIFRFLLSILLGCLLSCEYIQTDSDPIQNGHIDLSRWDPNSGPLNLKGEWQFCWDQLIPPDSKEEVWEKNCNGYFPVPSYWKFYEINGKQLSPFGKATYRLKIKLPESYSEPYSLLWTEILSAFEIFIDNRSVIKIGKVGDSFESMIPDLRPGQGYIGPLQNEITIVIWISNFNHQNHGFWQPLYIGNWEKIRSKYSIEILIEVGCFASFCFIGLYHLIAFLFRTQSKEYLFFGLFCILMGIRQLSLENHSFYIFFPEVGFDSYIRIIYFIVIANATAMCWFIKSLFSNEIPSVFIILITSILTAFVLALFLPVRVFTQFSEAIFLLITFLPLSFIPFLIKAWKNHKEGAMIILFANVIFTLTIINDILFTLGYVSTGYFSHIGIIFFILLEAVVLAKKLAMSIQNSEKLTVELELTLEKNIRAHREILKLKELQKTSLETQVALRTQELVKARNEAESANKVKSQFLAAMSHEIRTPLNGVIGLSEQFKSTPLDANQEHILSLIRSSGDTLLKIINNILDYSKLEAEKIELEIDHFSWKVLVKEIEGIYSYQIKQKDIDLSIEFFPDFIDEAAGDEHRIKQILSNLVSNAVKFTDSGRIEIRLFSQRLEELEHRIEYKVRIIDTGVGIPKEKIDFLFQKFFQLDSSISRKYGGTGLGLAISKKLVELMDGTIQAMRNQEKGSTFEFSILLFEDASYKPIKQTKAIDFSKLSLDTNILIAEDDSTNIFLLSQILKKLNISHDIAKDGIEVIEKVKKSKFDLIFMDINMPRLDGISASEFILNDPNIAEKPIIIAVTADVLQEDKTKCTRAGMSGFLAKPYSRKEIEQMIYDWLIEQKQ
ncbi:ATP-binding protein [Leptospira sp. WS92.C1]